ncbi:MAG: hypothetical protein KAH15_03890, partial [Candidatus Marinimicrobia bacterium]|nr:hypothetical protein [Candidatus Neomarinimicrobiota bacterium]
MKKIISLGFVLLSAMAFFSCGGGSQVINKTIPSAYNDQGRKIQQIYSAAQVLLENCKLGKLEGVEMVRHARLDTLMYDRDAETLDVYFNRYFAYRPLREESVKAIYDNFKAELGSSFDKYDITLYSTRLPIHDLIPNYFIENPED